MSEKHARHGGGSELKSLYSGFLALGVIIGLLLGLANGAALFSPAPQPSSGTSVVLPPAVAGEKAVSFVANYALSPGVEISLVNVTEVETGDLYELSINLSTPQVSETQVLYLSRDGRWLFPGSIDLSKFTIGNFLVSGDARCTEDGKPIVYFFGSDSCSACRWEHPVLAEVAARFEGYISVHDNMNHSEADGAIFERYSPDGTIPTLVLGCTYYRIGAGVPLGTEQEEQVLTALICTLTDNEPEAVCRDSAVQALVAQIGEPAR
jgi:thiol-disulfide isomerase/thioredoxin